MATGLQNKFNWWQIALMGILAALFILFAAGLGRDTKFIPSPLIGKAAFEFNLERLDGEGKLSLIELRGQGVVMNFWASWCVSCREEHHVLIDVADRYKDSDKIRFIGINHKDTAKAAETFLKSRGRFPYPSLIDGQGRLGLEYGVYGMPETFFINGQGIVVAKHIGALTKKVLLEKIKLIGGGA